MRQRVWRSFLLCADESPNLIHFDLFAGQAAHFSSMILQALPTRTRKAHNRVLVDAGDALNGADACPSPAWKSPPLSFRF
jgi:hypothetical protein